MSGSVSSIRSRGSSYAESTPGTSPGINGRAHPSDVDLWAAKKSQVHHIDIDRRGSMSTDNGSHSGSTLPPGDDTDEMELKTPRAVREKLAFVHGRDQAMSPLLYDEVLPSSTFASTNGDAFNHPQSTHAAGSMSELLHTLLSKVSSLERRQPTVMAQEHTALQTRFRELEKDHKYRTEEYLDLVRLRNGDLENLIKVRDLLAKERRAHGDMIDLRDEDLKNVLELRERLADATWAATRPGMPGAASPSGHSHSSSGAKLSMKQSDYLWQVARTAAMEQRVLELESANKTLRDELKISGGPGASAAAAAAAAAAHIALTPSHTPTGTAQVGVDNQFVSRIETMFEDSLKQREKVATKMQAMRSEKEGLQKEVAALEDRNTELEALVERLQRNLRV